MREKERKGVSIESVLNTVARGTVIEGRITTKGDIRVEGTVIGSVKCEAKLVVGEHGLVDGDVDSKTAYISGTVKGKVLVRELLQLQESGKIEGDIITQKLSVQIGATFTGSCKMGNDAMKSNEQKLRNEPQFNSINTNGKQQPVQNPFLKPVTNPLSSDEQKETSA